MVKISCNCGMVYDLKRMVKDDGSVEVAELGTFHKKTMIKRLNVGNKSRKIKVDTIYFKKKRGAF